MLSYQLNNITNTPYQSVLSERLENYLRTEVADKVRVDSEEWRAKELRVCSWPENCWRVKFLGSSQVRNVKSTKLSVWSEILSFELFPENSEDSFLLLSFDVQTKYKLLTIGLRKYYVTKYYGTYLHSNSGNSIKILWRQVDSSLLSQRELDLLTFLELK